VKYVTETTDNQIRKAADMLHQGRLVAFPTETVYGLGADASSQYALKRLYQVKGRPTDHPVIVHLAGVTELANWAKDIPPIAYKLAEAFWPGPMTLILPKADHVSLLVTGGQLSIGLRVPSHPVALRLLQAFGGGVAAPSANRFGRLSPTTADAVTDSLGSDVDMVLDGGPCEVGIESTIISLIGDVPAISRPGMIDREKIEAVLGFPVQACAVAHGHSSTARDVTAGGAAIDVQTNSIGAAIRVPGALPSHYAPHTPMAVTTGDILIELFAEGMAIGRSQGVIAFADTVEIMQKNFGEKFYSAFPCEAFIVAPENAEAYAQMLYDSLRKMDQLALHKILVEAVPTGAAWDGLRDRLARASAEQRAHHK